MPKTQHPIKAQLNNLRMYSFILVAMHSSVIHLSAALAVSHLFPLAVTLYCNNVTEQKQNCLLIHTYETRQLLPGTYSSIYNIVLIFCLFVCPFVTPFASTRSRGPRIVPSIFNSLYYSYFVQSKWKCMTEHVFAISVLTSALFFLKQLF